VGQDKMENPKMHKNGGGTKRGKTNSDFGFIRGERELQFSSPVFSPRHTTLVTSIIEINYTSNPKNRGENESINSFYPVNLPDIKLN